MAIAKHPALNPREMELWHLFVQETFENLKANTEDTLRERANKEKRTPNTAPSTELKAKEKNNENKRTLNGTHDNYTVQMYNITQHILPLQCDTPL